MMSKKHSVLLAVLLCAPPALQANPPYVLPEDASPSRMSLLTEGREIWLDNCETCHGYGIADAPVPMNPDEWSFRVIKSKDLLYEHAINGFTGPDYSHMPARGGNENLTDDEIKRAVDYMVFLANYYIGKDESK